MYIRVSFVTLLTLMLAKCSLGYCEGDPHADPTKCSNQCLNNCDMTHCTSDCYRAPCSCHNDYLFDRAVGRCVRVSECTSRKDLYRHFDYKQMYNVLGAM